jgi:hypothetical protein
VGKTLYFPQFGKGENFVSSLFLINPPGNRGQDAKGTLAFFDEEGNSLAIAVNDLPPASEIPFDIAPSGGAVFQTDPQGLLAFGSAQAILTEGLIGGVLHFEYSGGARVGLGPSEPLSDLISLVRRDTVSGLNTQLAIGSTGSEVTLELKLRTANGDEVPEGTAQFQLPANGHLAGLINELFPQADTTDFQGTVTVTAVGGEVSVSALQVGGQPDQRRALTGATHFARS